jgi:predicted Zn-dependent protease
MMATNDRLVRLDDEQRILSRAECERLVERVASFARGGGITDITLSGWWHGELRWGRNRVSLASDRRDLTVSVQRLIAGRLAGASTNQVDDESLQGVIRAAERRAFYQPLDITPSGTTPPMFEYPRTEIWSDATYALTTGQRAEAARRAIDPAEAEGLLAAGYLQVAADATASTAANGPLMYAQQTRAQCSITVRDAQGRGSGWAGLSSYDWPGLDTAALAKRAVEKCLASRDPVSLEPGRYTVILEPQAVHDLVQVLFGLPLARTVPETSGSGPFVSGYDDALGLWRSKLGQKVADERVTIGYDPADPLLGVVPFGMDGAQRTAVPMRAVNWIEHGILTNLGTDRMYALMALNQNLGTPQPNAYRMSGGTVTLDEMIATTKRGLLVTRFSNVRQLDEASLLATGLTRDGLWLVENGKISKAVKNFRFVDSPLFVLNSIEQLGEAVPVFSPNAPAVVPPLKARDFSFTSVIDAI